MSRVKAHTRTVNGRKVRVTQHNRKGGNSAAKLGMKLRPSRAWKNAKRSHRAARGGYKAAAFCWGTAATAEILAWTVLKGAGGILSILGVVLAAAGAASLRRTA